MQQSYKQSVRVVSHSGVSVTNRACKHHDSITKRHRLCHLVEHCRSFRNLDIFCTSTNTAFSHCLLVEIWHNSSSFFNQDIVFSGVTLVRKWSTKLEGPKTRIKAHFNKLHLHSLYFALFTSFWMQNFWLGGLKTWGSVPYYPRPPKITPMLMSLYLAP